MRVPRLITFSVGALVGAAVMYLSDEQHGQLRRRGAAKDAVRLAGRAGRYTASSAVSLVGEFGSVARDTFIAEREGQHGSKKAT